MLEILLVKINLLFFFDLLRIFFLEQLPLIIINLTLNLLPKLILLFLFLHTLNLLHLLYLFHRLLFLFLFQLVLLLRLSPERLIVDWIPLLPHVHNILFGFVVDFSLLLFVVFFFFLFFLPVIEFFSVDGEPV